MKPAALIALVTFLAVATAHGVEDATYLWVLGGQPVPEDVALGDDPVVTELTIDNPEKLAERLTRSTTLEVIATTPDSLRLLVDSGARIRGAPEDRHLTASFVIDYDVAAVAELVDDLAVTYETTPTPDELRSYVFRHVDEPQYARGLDIASRVAETGEGDCTEHAVLLAALARASGYPARVVFGVLLMNRDDSGLQAFGHAWAELYVDESWQVVDSTTAAEDMPDIWLRYVPLMELSREDLGFGMTLLDLATVLPSEVSLSFD